MVAAKQHLRIVARPEDMFIPRLSTLGTDCWACRRQGRARVDRYHCDHAVPAHDTGSGPAHPRLATPHRMPWTSNATG
jgi:hypothetical protein